MAELASRARVTYALKPRKRDEKTNLTFQQVPEPDACAGSGLRTGPKVLSKRKLISVLTLWRSAE